MLEYENFYQGITHFCIEQNEMWKEDFIRYVAKRDPGYIKIFPLEIKEFMGKEGIKCYCDFSSNVPKQKYDLIIVDGPWGSEGYSRIDILEIVPECLEKSFIIMIDDYNSTGAEAMVYLLEEKLKESNIEYSKGLYCGICSCLVLTSKDREFFCSM